MFFSILSVFLWKNIKRVLHFKKTFVFILAISIGLIYVVALIGSLTSSDNSYDGSNIDDFTEWSESKLLESDFRRTFSDDDKFVYTPNTKFYTKLIEDAGQKLNVLLENLIGFHNLTDLENNMHLAENGSESTIVIFNNPEVTKPRTINYIIRKKSYQYGWSDSIYHDSVRQSKFSEPYSSFIEVQVAIEKSFMELLVNKKNSSLPTIAARHNPMKLKKMRSHLDLDFFSFVVFISYLMLTISLLLSAIVEEKQDGIKEILSIATSYSYVNQVALFLIIFLIALLSILGQCGFALYYNTFNCTNIVFPFILIVLYVCALMSYTFFVSAFFDSVTYASIIGSTFYIIPFLIWESATNVALLWFRWLSPIKLYSDGMNIFIKYRNTERCFTFNDMMVSDHPVNGYSLLTTYLFLIGISVMYLFLYYYLSNAFPGRTGTPRSKLFLCMPSFWRSNKIDQTATPTSFVVNDLHQPNSICKVHELSKSFRKSIFSEPFTAVKNVSFEIPKNRVTILLGHNGAGKTTTMSMITGIVPPSGGRISVDNECDVNLYRSCIGYCPQHDVFISYMSCRDHLILFGRLRGLTKVQANEDADIILQKVRLTLNANKPAKTLSRGMKRRLCLACAVIGQTKLIILDEPSTGLDPESRRDLWDVILPLRKERSILLTTHSMEEADVLGDKIIIMDHGNIICEGTQMSLKRRYGSGYRLKILMADNFDMNETLNLITGCISDASVKSETHPTLIISLPYDEMSKFSSALKELESKQKELGIESISLSHSTMEEVFLNSATTVIDPMAQTDSDEVDSKYIRIENQNMPQKPKFLFFNRFLAIFYKKLIFMKRSWIKYLIHFLIPIATVLLVFWFHLHANKEQKVVPEYDKFELNANKLNNPDVILVINQTNRDHRDITDKFSRLAREHKLNPVVVYNGEINSVFKDRMNDDILHYNERTIGGIQVDNNSSHLTAMYQNNILFSHPFMINFGNNLILRILDIPNSKIVVSYHPMARIYKTDMSYMFVTLLPNFLPVGLYFYVLVYMSLPHTEEVTEFRIIQRITPWLFWFSTYLFDVICHTLMSTVLIIVITVCSGKLFSVPTLVNIYFTVLVIGFVYIPLLYIYAKLFKKLSTAYAILFYGCFICWIVSFIFMSEEATHLFPKTYFIFQFHPEFAIRYQLNLAIIVHSMNPEQYKIGRLLGVYLGEALVLLLIIIFVFENIYVNSAVNNVMVRLNPIRCIKRACKKKRELGTQPLLPPDQYVEVEKELVKAVINAADLESYALVVSQLRKNYVDFPAVKGVNFTVNKGECFGLLGMNGAGKSTIFKMMTLNSSITGGDIFINGFHVKKQKNRYQQEFGYCPEVDALVDCMTSFELLKYMALLKGTSFANVNNEVCDWITKMDLSKFKHQPSGSYSGGTKRKLNTAISMISDPKLIFLDEPTSGVDPVSRRFMWKCIREFQKNQQTVVLTSHSMDECEELCNRLAIMVTGDFKCIGNIQKLKLIFGTGFTLLVKVSETAEPKEIEKIKSGINDLFQCNLRDDYAGTLAYNVIEKNIHWSHIFGKVYDFSQQNSGVIEDFAINEISLEDIFLQFRTENAGSFGTADLESSRL